jgi:hypothetical protein
MSLRPLLPKLATGHQVQIETLTDSSLMSEDSCPSAQSHHANQPEVNRHFSVHSPKRKQAGGKLITGVIFPLSKRKPRRATTQNGYYVVSEKDGHTVAQLPNPMSRTF